MNRKKILIYLILMITVVIMFSCRFYPVGVDVIGVWDGQAQGLLEDASLFIEFKDDGTARLAGSLMTETGEQQEYKWSMTDYHLELSVTFTNFKSLYAYKWDADNLTLYMLDDTAMTPEWDNLIPGYEIDFTRAADGVTIADLVSLEE
ncbi:MAG: hypothetical protein PQJ61_16220 [Spirochaetales bacterium]|uniref:Lipocalin-like domain-containing protein n=1 Tax=Candidatus Thalassospirochaeta sargassi TaxID=3119039 RepID=A0AAJ1IHL0_9SPIO|nr:hypothetical protein [Spirochaetales bacterium]